VQLSRRRDAQIDDRLRETDVAVLGRYTRWCVEQVFQPIE